MLSISTKEFLLWEKKQLSKGGDKQSLALLLDVIGGISRDQLNLVRLNICNNLSLKKKLEVMESIWEIHLNFSIPIQYLCNTTFWRDLKLQVTEKVLIPRPETELIIDIILKIFEKNSNKLLFAELGTGSGAISIALAMAKPMWEGIATDIDKNALDIASRNFLRSSNQKNLKFYCGNWWDPFKNLKGKLDLVISNPPLYRKISIKNYQ